jgi:hypothetical protein
VVNNELSHFGAELGQNWEEGLPMTWVRDALSNSDVARASAQNKQLHRDFSSSSSSSKIKVLSSCCGLLVLMFTFDIYFFHGLRSTNPRTVAGH